jgi:hypothetical protein
MVDSSYARSGKRVRSIVVGLDVAPKEPISDAFGAIQEKFRERMVLFSERQGVVARSTILLAMECRLQKKYAFIENVVDLWKRLRTDNTGRGGCGHEYCLCKLSRFITMPITISRHDSQTVMVVPIDRFRRNRV